MKKRIAFVGLDTHKNSIEVALVDDGRNTEVRLYGSIGGDLASLDKMIRKLQTTGAELRFVYEAGPCGYEIYRHLQAQGFHCDVVAPPPWSPSAVGIASRPTGAMPAIWRDCTAPEN
jgi:transposase